MTAFLKWIGKVVLSAVFWVFVLSIQVQGRPLFFMAHDTLIENELVRKIDEYLVDIWVQAKETAVKTYEDITGKKSTVL